jgi:hypothetical protein
MSVIELHTSRTRLTSRKASFLGIMENAHNRYLRTPGLQPLELSLPRCALPSLEHWFAYL